MSEQKSLEIALYYIVPHPNDAKIALVQENHSWRLPSASLEIEESHPFPYYEDGMAVQIVDGIPISALNLLAYQQEHKRNIFVTENINSLIDLPQDIHWVTEQDAITYLADDALTPLLNQYFEEQGTGNIPPFRAAWTVTGWREKNIQWIAEQLAHHNLQQTAEIELIRKWCLSVIKKIPTNEGDVFFKTAATVFGREVSLTNHLAQMMPSYLPSILTADTDNNFMLMRDMGGKKLWQHKGAENLHLWLDAAQKYAQLQLATVDKTQEFFDLGAQDNRLATLYKRFEAYVNDDTLMQADDQISTEDITKLRENLGIFKERIESLQSHAIPATIIHCDLHVGNIQLADDETPIFYDWTDMSIGHPFMDMTTFMWGVGDIFKEEPDSIKQIKAAYLTPFTEYAPLKALQEALETAINIGLIVQVLNYHYLLENLEPQVRWSLDFRNTFLKSLADSLP